MFFFFFKIWLNTKLKLPCAPVNLVFHIGCYFWSLLPWQWALRQQKGDEVVSDLYPQFDILSHSLLLFSFSVERVYDYFSCRAFESSDKGVKKSSFLKSQSVSLLWDVWLEAAIVLENEHRSYSHWPSLLKIVWWKWKVYEALIL